MSLLLLTYGYGIGWLTHGSIYIFSNRMQRTLNVLFVERCASNTSSSTVTSEVDSSNANVEGPIATSSGTTTKSSDAYDNVSYPETEAVEIDDEDEHKPNNFVPTSFFKLVRKESTKGNWVFPCKWCFKKEISCSYKSRGNLQSHIKSKHTGALATFDKLCKAYNNRQQKDTDKNNARTGTCDKSNKLVSSSTGLTSPKILTHKFWSFCY